MPAESRTAAIAGYGTPNSCPQMPPSKDRYSNAVHIASIMNGHSMVMSSPDSAPGT